MQISVRQQIERGIFKRVVRSALAKGCTLSLCDGEEWTVKLSRDSAQVLGAAFTVDEERLRVRDAGGVYIGDVFFVYGNDGFDAIADRTDNVIMQSICADAERYADLQAMAFA